MELRHVDDYVEALKEHFPYVCEEDLKLIMNTGLRALYRLNLKGADVLLRNQEYSALFGNVNGEPDYPVKKFKKKLRIKNG